MSVRETDGDSTEASSRGTCPSSDTGPLDSRVLDSASPPL